MTTQKRKRKKETDPRQKQFRGMMTQEEVAKEMTRRGYPMSRARVHALEARALQKMRRDPLIRVFMADFEGRAR